MFLNKFSKLYKVALVEHILSIQIIPHTIKLLYIFPDRCCTRFDIHYFMVYLLWAINDSFFKLTMPIESCTPLKNDVSCNVMLKYHIIITLWQFTKTLNQFFVSLGQKKICKFACLFDLSNDL